MPPAPAPPPGVNIVPPASPPKPPPAPTREIKLGAENGPSQPPPKPGSAREAMSQRLRAKAGIAEPTPQPAAPPPPVPEAPPETPPADQPPPSATAQPSGTPPPSPAKGEKVNPWKLVDSYKGKIATLERQLSEAGTVPQEKAKEYLSKIDELTKRNTELENEISFVNYEASEEFKTKFHAPYEAAWQRALSELSEITITDPNTNAPRQATPQDLWDILSVPLTKARELANQYFGDFADDIMAYRKEIKGLLDARQSALKEAKERGTQRDKTRQELAQRHNQEMSDFIKQNWEKSVSDLSKHEKYGRFFTPIDGDEDGNQRLAKGFALVDRAFSESPADPRLTPEQRSAVVARHAAVRARAAAFGRLARTVEKLEAEKAALETELSQYRSSTPPTSGSGTPPSGTPGAPASAREQIFGKLRSMAK